MSSIKIFFPTKDEVINTVIERGVLFAIPGKQGVGIPAGGTVGQLLRKKGASDYDLEWFTNAQGNITSGDIANWNQAYAWGNHASAGYLTAGSAAGLYQPLDAGLSAIAGLSGNGLVRKTGVSTYAVDSNTYLTAESDPLFSASAASTISSGNIANWNTAFGWGNHASAGYLTTLTIGTTTITSGTSGRILFEGTGNVLQESSNITWDQTNSRLAIGGLTPTARLHVASSASGSAFITQTSTGTETFRVYDSKNVNIGGGSVTANTDYKITAFGTATADTHINTQFIGYNNDSVVTIYNTNGYTRGGVDIKRDAYSYGRNALTITGGTTVGMTISSSGVITFNVNGSAWADTDGSYIQSVTTATHGAGKEGVLYNTKGGGAAASHIFRKGRNLVSTGTGAIVHLYSGYTENSASSNTTPMLKIAPLYNLTGIGVRNMIGIHYAPTITAMGLGTNVAMLAESGYVGIGMNTMPTSSLHLKGATGYDQIRLETTYTPSGTSDASGSSGQVSWDDNYIYWKVSTGWKRVAFSSMTTTGGSVTSVDMSVPTGFTIGGNPVTTSGTLALGFSAGYSLPATSDQTNWNTAFGWGNHASAGYLTTSAAASTYQPLDSDLTAIAALSTNGLARRTGAGAWSIDATVYVDQAGARTSISLTTTGTSGAATYNNSTGVLNIPNYATGGGGGMTWTEVTGTSQAISVNSGYIANNASQVAFPLPTSCAVGDRFIVKGKGAGGWRITQAAGQQIIWEEGGVAGLDNTTAGTSGYIESTDDHDAVELICTVANTTFSPLSSFGNINLN